MRIGSLFAGVGGFDLGFERAGFTTAWAVEIDEKAQAVLRLRFPKAELHDDVCAVGAHNLGPVDVVTFGSPCVDLSVSGKRAGLAGERSGLFHEATRVIRELCAAGGGPRFAVWENVPGAFSSNAGGDFACVLQEMAKLGAMDIAWRVLDSRYFAVAQRRRRVFLVADLGGERAGEVLSLTEGVPGYLGSSNQTSDGDPRGARKGAPSGGRPGPFWNGADVADTLTCKSDAQRMPDKNRMQVVVQPISFHPTQDPISSTDGTIHTLGCGSSSGCATGAVQQPMMAPRRLTPVECCRVTAFPDDWNAEGVDKSGKRIAMADSSRYKQMGNAVTVSVAHAIAERIRAVLERGE